MSEVLGGFSFTETKGDGATITFPFSFVGPAPGYISTDQIYVYVRDSDPASVNYNSYNLRSGPHSFPSPNTIAIKGAAIQAPVDGLTNIRIRRIVDKAQPYADPNTDDIFRKTVLNNSFLQMLYSNHEALDGFVGGKEGAVGNINMNSFLLYNLAPGTEDGHSVNYKQLRELREQLDSAVIDGSSLPIVGDFTTGCTVTSYTQAVRKIGGSLYVWNGPLPKVVPENSSPEDTGGVGEAAWLDAGDGSIYSRLIQTLGLSSGTSRIGHKGNVTGEGERTQEDINNDEKTIYDFLGNDDCVGDTTGPTNNAGPIAAYFQHLAQTGGVARFPKKGTGGYYINGGSPFNTMEGVEIVADEGVYFVFDGNWSPLITKKIKCNRQIRIHIVNLDYDFYMGPHQYRKPSEIMPSLTQNDGTTETPVSFSGTVFTGYQLDTANGRDVTPITTATDSVTIPFSSASQRKVAVAGARAGTEIGFTALSAVDGKVCLGVVTAIGYALVEQQLSDKSTVINKSGSALGLQLADYPGTRNQFNSSSLAVKILSHRKFCVLLNDISIGTFDAGAAITGIAIGSAATAASFIATNLYRIENSNAQSSRPLRILCLGDSTSDPNIPCSQFDYMRQFLAAAGAQVVDMQNLAVSGETSGQQRARFEGIGISGYDYVIAQLGVNDIQGGVFVNTFIANMEAIADRCIANNVTFIAGIPTMWYPRAEATPFGQTGQDTANAHLGSPYRNQLRRSMAAKGCLITSAPGRMEGVVAAKWLSHAGVDPVLMDNIHPTAYGRMMMGMGSAMAILGAQNQRNDMVPSAVTMPNRWRTAATANSVRVPTLLVRNGELTLKGSIDVASVPANGTALLTIDKELMNGTYNYYTLPVQTASGPTGACNAVIDPNGSLTVYAVPAGTTNIVLDCKVEKIA